ncbi:MAG TPA: prolyl oligopeptidase family serine peptidase, partial [Polyangiaceae bacterium]|nr:prolyl oligopeptidase family serine peptidase [Polyangiaceae bacterium]
MKIRALLSILALAPTLYCGGGTHSSPTSLTTAEKLPMHENAPPIAPVRPVVDTYFGVGVTDRYRWMENDASLEYGVWAADQNKYTRGLLDGIPGRAELAADIRAISKNVDEMVDIQETETNTIFSRKPAGASSAKLYVRGNDSKERVIFEPSGLSGPVTLDDFTASPDGRLVTVLTSVGGTEERTLSVVQTVDAQILSDRIERLREPSIMWLPGSRSFAYTRYPEAQNPLTRYNNAQTCIHHIGTDATSDRVVFGGAPLGGPSDDFPTVVVSQGSATALGIVYHGVLPEISLYVKPAPELETGSKWRLVAGPEDEITQVALRENDLYLLSFRGADRGRVLRTRANAPSVAGARPIVPESEDILEQVRPARDGFFALALRRGVHRLSHVSGTGERHEASLATEASVENFQSRASATGAILRVESYITSPIWMRWDGRDDAPSPLPFNPRPRAFAGVHVERTVAVSADGTHVPLTLLLPERAPRDGKQYVWLYGYGAGGYSMSPTFFSFRDAWLKHGGIWAIAHIRGGGELGAAWHRAGMKGNKENSIDDFIASAEKLIKDGYTSPHRMVANGRSAGGIVVGGAMTRRPELFRAVIAMSGGMNMLRLEIGAVGAENAREFGDTSTREGFEGLLKMDTVQRVRDGVSYPALLLQTGANDPKVPSWHSGKLIARVQAASTSGNPVLFSVAA